MPPAAAMYSSPSPTRSARTSPDLDLTTVPIGHRKDQGFAVLAAAPVAHAGAAVGGVPVGCVVVVEQGGGLGVDAQDDVAAVAAVAAVGTAEGLELLAVDGDTAVAAGTAGYVQYYPVYKARHVDLLSAVPRTPKGAQDDCNAVKTPVERT